MGRPFFNHLENTMARTSEMPKFKIKIAAGSENEERHAFVGGCLGGDVRIERGKWVTVNADVVERLRLAVKLVAYTPDANDPSKIEYIEQQRYPMEIEAL